MQENTTSQLLTMNSPETHHIFQWGC